MAAHTAASYRTLALALVCCAVAAGCKSVPTTEFCIPTDLPRELDKASLPTYVVEPPDIVFIEAVMIPGPAYRLAPLHSVGVRWENPPPRLAPGGMAAPQEAKEKIVQVDSNGEIDLSAFGAEFPDPIQVGGMTLLEAKKAIKATGKARDPQISVTLVPWPISGPRLVRPDGTVELGPYGSVRVVGRSVPEVARAVKDRLKEHFMLAEVTADVQGYNSKLVYVVLDGGGLGQQVVRLPFTGNETVLDAIAQVNGLSPVSSTDNIWVARPAPAGGPHQVLPVNWQAVAALADTGTNYQLMPGDRVYVAAQHLVATDTFIARILSPIERLLGATLLGNYTIRSVDGQRVNGGF